MDAPVDKVGREPVQGQRSIRDAYKSLVTRVAQQGTRLVEAEAVTVGAGLLFVGLPPRHAGAVARTRVSQVD